MFERRSGSDTGEPSALSGLAGSLAVGIGTSSGRSEHGDMAGYGFLMFPTPHQSPSAGRGLFLLEPRPSFH